MRSSIVLIVGVVAFLTLSSCSQLQAPDKQEAEKTPHWNAVRSQLKYQLAEEKFDHGRLDESYELVREAIELDPIAPSPYILLTQIHLDRGEIATASETIAKASGYGGNPAKIHYLTGLIAQRYRHLDEALQHYKAAAEADKSNAHYLVTVAETLVALGRVDEALELVRDRWTDFDHNVALRDIAGGIHTMLGQHELAANAYQEAVQLNSEDKGLQRRLVSALMKIGRHEEARRILTTLIEDDPSPNPSVLLDLGQCQMALHQVDEAKTLFRRVTQQAPASHEGWVWLARAAVLSGDLKTARGSAHQAASLQPAVTEYQLLLATVCWLQKDVPAALAALDRILQQQPDDRLALALRARIAKER